MPSYESFSHLIHSNKNNTGAAPPAPPATSSSGEQPPAAQRRTPTRRERFGSPRKSRKPDPISVEPESPSLSGLLHSELLQQPSHHQHQTRSPSRSKTRQHDLESADPSNSKLSTPRILLLVLSLLAATLLWSLEFAYGNPYLLSLGLSRSAASLIWLAGPVAGLVCQPVVGSLSDNDASRFRRRKYILGSFVLCACFALLVAYAQPLARFLLRLLSNIQDWDPSLHHRSLRVAVWIAVPSFWGLDFALNALQASSRALVLDTVPGHQQPSANAWQGKVCQIGNVVGYGLGFTDLGDDRILRHVPGGQFGRLVVLGLLVSGVCVAATCFYISEKPVVDEAASDDEEEEDDEKEVGALKLLRNIRMELLGLPPPIRSVCMAQFFSWIGWFPFLFFASTFISERFAVEHDFPPTSDIAVRSGSLALLYHALVGLAASAILPMLYWLGKRPTYLPHWLLPLFVLITPRNIWCASQALFAILTFAMFFSQSTTSGVVEVAMLGTCWAVTAWVPFAMVMEMIHELNDAQLDGCPPSPSRAMYSNRTNSPLKTSRAVMEDATLRSQVNSSLSECSSLLNNKASKRVSGGTILGIHNLAIVLPQFLTSVLASIIFRFAQPPARDTAHAGAGRHGPDGIAIVFLLGSFSALTAALLVRRIPLTESEMMYRNAYREGEADRS